MSALTVIPRPQAPEFSLNEVGKIASVIAAGKLFGSTDVDAVMTLCLLAHAEGMHPVAVMRDYHMIQGKPSKKSEAMQRDFLAAGGSIEWHKLDDTAAEATFSHPAGGSVRIDWTLDRAQKAGLLGNAMWKKYPRQMLKSRLISEGARTVFPGATSGMYVPEEVADIEEDKRSQGITLASPDTERPIDNPHAMLEAPPRKPSADWPAGPCTSKTGLMTEYKAFVHYLHGSTNADDVEGAIADASPMLAQFRAAAKVNILAEEYQGGGDFPGVVRILADARARCVASEGIPQGPGEVAGMEAGIVDTLFATLEQPETIAALKKWAKINSELINEQIEEVRDALRLRYGEREAGLRAVQQLAA